MRSREHLTPDEVDALIKAAKGNRYAQRDSLMIMMAYRHGLRCRELRDLEWTQVDFKAANLHVNRRKNGSEATHPIQGDELRPLRQLRRDNPHSRFIFITERGAPFSTNGFASLVARAGEAANLGFKVHPHMLRHACGFRLANDRQPTRNIQAYLGHKNIQHTVKYTALSPAQFNDFRW